MGFIEDYKNFIMKYVKATNPDWAESVAVNILNAAIGNNVHIWTKYGEMYSNLFFLNIGASGLAHKTVPIKNFAIPTLIRYGELTDTKPILPSRFSVEGMLEYLPNNQSVGLIIRDEFSSIFKDARKQYIADILEFLSELYDGTIQKRYTKKAKLEETLDVCVSFTSATTPYIFDLIDLNFFLQGTGNRFLYIWSEPKIPPKTTKSFFMQIEDRVERLEEMERFAERLAKIRNAITRKYDFLQPAYFQPELLMKFRDEMSFKCKQLFEKDPKGIDHSYLSRMAEMAIKLSAIKAISMAEERLPSLEIQFFPVHATNVKWAIDKVRKHIKYFEDVKTNWSTFVKTKPVMTEERQFEYLKNILRTHKNKLPRTKLYKLSKWKLKQFEEVIDGLRLRGEIIVYEGAGSPKGGPKPIIYELVDEPHSLKKSEIRAREIPVELRDEVSS